MTAYTVYFASRSILYAETKIEAETPGQALERAMEMAEDEGGTLLDLRRSRKECGRAN
jgi:hypothetical protein